MYIIKNRVNGEYDRRGSDNTFDKVKRGAWDKIGHAKNHVGMRIGNLYGVNHTALTWYLDADFIEIDESGTTNIIPVSDYLHNFLAGSIYIKFLTGDEKKRLGLEVSDD